MITKLTLTDHLGKEYELPHNLVNLNCYFEGKATYLKANIISDKFYPSAGNKVKLYIDSKLIFIGKVFSHLTQNSQVLMVCYDDIFYFKGKINVLYKYKTASDILRDICKKIGLKTGNIEDTNYRIPYLFYENMTAFDILSDILNQTQQMTKNKYQIYDNLGNISLRNVKTNQTTYEISEDIKISKVREVSFDKIYNSVIVYQVDKFGFLHEYVKNDDKSIMNIGKFTKTVKVNRELNSTQCKTIASNTLSEFINGELTEKITIIADKVIKIGDYVILDARKYLVYESQLLINSSVCTYDLTLKLSEV